MRCRACRAPLEGRRKGTRYCDSSCRKKGHRRRHRVAAAERFWSQMRENVSRRGLVAR